MSLNDSESKLQQKCFMWFWNNYCLKHHSPRLTCFSIPNEGKDKMEQIKKKAMGLNPGASDFVLCFPNGRVVFIEFKTETGIQSDKQKEFELTINELGNNYYIVRNFEQFQDIVFNNF